MNKKTIEIQVFVRKEWHPVSFSQLLDARYKLTIGYKSFKILVDGEEVYTTKAM